MQPNPMTLREPGDDDERPAHQRPQDEVRPGERGGAASKPSEHCHVAIDLNSKGEVIGIEAVEISESTIAVMLCNGNVPAPPAALKRTRYISAELAYAGGVD